MIAPIKKRLAQAFPIYELKITLRGSNPAIWRRVQVPGTVCLRTMTSTPAVSSVTNDVFAWLTSRNVKRQP
jgi:hypothetical protein